MRSLAGKIDEVKIRVLQLRPSVIVFTESWLSEEIPDEDVALDGFVLSRKDRNKHGGGIACYVDKDIPFSAVETQDIPLLPVSDSEIHCLFLESFYIFLICVYHPFWENQAANEAAISSITCLIDFAFVKFGSGLNILLCGDFNGLRVCFDEISRLTHLSPVVNFPTRGSNTLDQIFSSFQCEQKPLSFPPFGRSDHLVIFWSPSRTRNKPAVKLSVRKVNKSNLARFRCFVSNIDWLALVNSSTDVDISCRLLMTHLVDLYDVCFPLKVIRIRVSDPAWMRPSLKLLINERDRAFSKKQWSKFHRLREEVIRHTRLLKSSFLEKAVSEGSKATWQAVRHLGRFKSSSSRISFSPAEFSAYFSSNFQTFSDSSSHTPLSAIDAFVTPEEVYWTIRHLRNKGQGPDGFPAWLLKDSALSLSSAICVLLNRCFEVGSFPSLFKFANVVPVPKLSNPKNISDYRPISMLPILSKLLEKLFLKKVLFPLISNRVSESQFAYIPRLGSGTTSALVTVQHHILQFLDSSSGAVRLLSTDFSKAFDKIPHHVILTACRRFDLPDSVIGFVSCFLKQRSQRVIINNEVSDWVHIPSGVPQGSVLGPILFCLAVDALTPVCSNSTIVKYADDISILHFVREAADDRLQEEWENIVSWSRSAHLPLNLNKCRVLDFVTKRSLSLQPVVVSPDVFLEQVDSHPFLGVRFCTNLKWDIHFDFILKKASKRIFIIRNLRRSGASPSLMWRTYVALIRPILLYAFPCICNAPNFLWDKLVRVERRVCRIISDNSVCNPSLLYAADLSGLRFFSKIAENVHHPLRKFFGTKVSHRSSRSVNTLYRPFAKTKRFSLSFIKYCK